MQQDVSQKIKSLRTPMLEPVAVVLLMSVVVIYMVAMEVAAGVAACRWMSVAVVVDDVGVRGGG